MFIIINDNSHIIVVESLLCMNLLFVIIMAFRNCMPFISEI